MQKKSILLILGIAAASMVFAGGVAQAGVLPMIYGGDNGSSRAACANESVFDRFSRESVLWNEQVARNKTTGKYLGDNGTLAYLYDDFSMYANNQQVIDNFDDAAAWSSSSSSLSSSATIAPSLSSTSSVTADSGRGGKFRLVDEYYSGPKALAYVVPSGVGKVVLSRAWDAPRDFGRWSQSGYITMWMKIGKDNSDGIDSVNVVLEDQSGNRRTYAPLPNVHLPVQNNTFANDPAFPDLAYPEGNPKTEAWTDFVLAGGWNYLLWRADDFSEDAGKNVDMAKISKVYLEIDVNEKSAGQELILDDMRIQDGLQKSSNPTGGMWFPPHGRPQYGIYDIDKNDDHDKESYQLSLLNVRNTQYPSNGDHARMISSAPVPKDFVMRVKFTLTQLGQPDQSLAIPSPFPAWTPKELKDVPLVKGMRDNTYFRVTYDFEPDWDPGHEWFGPYISMQYNKFGILTVWPLERNVLQDQEPKAGETTATTEFVPQSGVQYEMQVLAKGQFVSATIYEVTKKQTDDGNNNNSSNIDNGRHGDDRGNVRGGEGGAGGEDCLVRKSTMSYTFEHPRHGDDKRYPLAIESTGNVRTIVHEVELVSLEKQAS